MFAGFDYGTSNCAIGTMNDKQCQLIPLFNDQVFIPSALYILDRRLISESVLANVPSPSMQQQFANDRARAIQMGKGARRELGIGDAEQTWFVGEEAIREYVSCPGEGWFMKSPKSFLGATGLQSSQFSFFEDIVCLMMQYIKHRAEQRTHIVYDQVVIGRPINFQGLKGEESNRQAISIISNAAKLAGFKDVEFFYEPLAAGIDFELSLEQNQTVLVLDLGGGTSDCSMVRMGPSYRDNDDRSHDFLAHSGVRVGGNDLDISLNFQEVMPLFGRNSELKSGLPVPAKYYFNASRVNDINAQVEFASRQYVDDIARLLQDSQNPHYIKRLQQLQGNQQNYQLSRSVEQCKIGLSQQDHFLLDLSYIEDKLQQTLTVSDFEEAIERPLHSITQLIDETIKEAGEIPNILYITGGTAKSPTVLNAIKHTLSKSGSDISIVDGDYFGSVTAGLTLWAEKLFK